MITTKPIHTANRQCNLDFMFSLPVSSIKKKEFCDRLRNYALMVDEQCVERSHDYYGNMFKSILHFQLYVDKNVADFSCSGSTKTCHTNFYMKVHSNSAHSFKWDGVRQKQFVIVCLEIV